MCEGLLRPRDVALSTVSYISSDQDIIDSLDALEGSEGFTENLIEGTKKLIKKIIQMIKDGFAWITGQKVSLDKVNELCDKFQSQGSNYKLTDVDMKLPYASFIVVNPAQGMVNLSNSSLDIIGRASSLIKEISSKNDVAKGLSAAGYKKEDSGYTWENPKIGTSFVKVNNNGGISNVTFSKFNDTKKREPRGEYQFDIGGTDKSKIVANVKKVVAMVKEAEEMLGRCKKQLETLESNFEKKETDKVKHDIEVTTSLVKLATVQSRLVVKEAKYSAQLISMLVKRNKS